MGLRAARRWRRLPELSRKWRMASPASLNNHSVWKDLLVSAARRHNRRESPSMVSQRLFFAAAFFATALADVRGAPLPAAERAVVLISIDGFPAWIWRDPALPVPTFRRLAREGATAS